MVLGNSLDPDSGVCTVFGLSFFWLDPDPDSMNTDLKHCPTGTADHIPGMENALRSLAGDKIIKENK